MNDVIETEGSQYPYRPARALAEEVERLAARARLAGLSLEDLTRAVRGRWSRISGDAA